VTAVAAISAMVVVGMHLVVAVAAAAVVAAVVAVVAFVVVVVTATIELTFPSRAKSSRRY
jgi:hypothetical protein